VEKITEFIDNKIHLLTIGKIEFYELPDESYWLENHLGEGTQVGRDLLKQKIEDLFEQVF